MSFDRDGRLRDSYRLIERARQLVLMGRAEVAHSQELVAACRRTIEMVRLRSARYRAAAKPRSEDTPDSGAEATEPRLDC